MKDSFGDRMKEFEDVFRAYLPKELPIILRLDGVSFHRYTQGLKRPVDENLVSVMNETALHLCSEVQGARLAFIQSDEISILIINNFGSEPWFGNNVQKIVSVSAAKASTYFSLNSNRIFGEIRPAEFDARVFVVPKHEVVNAFYWRQKDAERNSLNSLARSLYSHKECKDKKLPELHEMCWKKGINWSKLPTDQKRGRCVVKVPRIKFATNKKTGEKVEFSRGEWIIDNNIPIFGNNKEYIEQYLIFGEDHDSRRD